jgi:hypothetical protein
LHNLRKQLISAASRTCTGNYPIISLQSSTYEYSNSALTADKASNYKAEFRPAAISPYTQQASFEISNRQKSYSEVIALNTGIVPFSSACRLSMSASSKGQLPIASFACTVLCIETERGGCPNNFFHRKNAVSTCRGSLNPGIAEVGDRTSSYSSTSAAAGVWSSFDAQVEAEPLPHSSDPDDPFHDDWVGVGQALLVG